MATVFEKQWFTKANIELDNASTTARGADLLYQIKRLLTGQSGAPFPAWTVIGSCDGVTFGMDGVDRWASAANVVYTSGFGPRAWIILRSPAPVPFYVSLGVAINSPVSCLVVVSSFAPSGNGTLADPPGLPNGVGRPNVNPTPLPNVADGPTRLACGVSDDGAFFFLTRGHGAGNFNSGFIFSPLVETLGADTFPGVVISAYNNSFNQSLFTSLDDTGEGNRMVPQTRNPDGSATAARLMGLAWITSGAFARNNALVELMRGDFVDGGALSDDHIYVMSDSGALKRSMKGRVQDIRWAPSIVHGSVEPDYISPRSMGVGYFWFPMSEAPNMS